MDKALQKEQARERMKRYRQRNKDGSVTSSVVPSVTDSVTVSTEKAAKLLLICRSLDKVVAGLDGQTNLLEMVRFGIFGLTMLEVKNRLE